MTLETKRTIYSNFLNIWFLVSLFLKVGGVEPISSLMWVPWAVFATLPLWGFILGFTIYLTTKFKDVEEMLLYLENLDQEIERLENDSVQSHNKKGE